MKLPGRLIFIASLLLAPGVLFAQQVPSGRAIDLTEILDLSMSFGGFLMVLGGILGGVAVILAGIYYLLAGSDSTRVKAAKDMLKAGIIGTLLIFISGVIIATIAEFAQNPLGFFQ